MSKRRRAPSHALRRAGSWPARSARHRAVRPTRGSASSRPDSPLTQRAHEHRHRSGHEGQDQSGDDRQADRAQGDQAGRQQQPEHDEQPDLGQPRDALGERSGRGSVRQLLVAEHQGGDVHGGEARGVQRRRAAVRQQRQAQHRERVEAGGRQRGATHHPGAAEPAPRPRSPRRRPARRPTIPATRGRPVLRDGSGRDHGDEHDGGGVVESGLRLEGADQPLRQRHRRSTEKTAAASVGERDRPEQHGQLPRQPEQVVGADRHDRHRHRDTEVASDQPQLHRRAHLTPLGGETTLGEDQRQRREAERVRELRVVEADPERRRRPAARPSAGRSAGWAAPTLDEIRTARIARKVTADPTSTITSSWWTSKVTISSGPAMFPRCYRGWGAVGFPASAGKPALLGRRIPQEVPKSPLKRGNQTGHNASHEQVRRGVAGQRAAVPRDGPAGGGGASGSAPTATWSTWWPASRCTGAPRPVRDEAIRLLASGEPLGYTQAAGIPELREAIAAPPPTDPRHRRRRPRTWW